ncbi:MAG: CPBP family intramembrane metalloprotease, partial [Phycisphaerales bacterium]|nr:CPBP family intramembrane metalloprotease [Phycisphaerales bacterium]
PEGTGGSVGTGDDRGAAGRVVASGLLFGAMHVSLFFYDNDPRTAATIVVATTTLGLICAWSRERSGSLFGPVCAHFAFNVCGLVGGVAVMIAKRVLSG